MQAPYATSSPSNFLFIGVFPDTARQVKPLLLFHRAEALKVFGTSHLYSGRSNPQQDQDLDAVEFGDMPWILGTNNSVVGQYLTDSWSSAPEPLLRLYAFGADAYALAQKANQMRGDLGNL